MQANLKMEMRLDKILAIFLLSFASLFLCCQNSYGQFSENCENAPQLCSGQLTIGSTQNGEPFNFPGSCFSGAKTVWFTFTTGSNGGDATVTLDSLVQTGGDTNRIRAAILSHPNAEEACENPTSLSVVSGRCPVGDNILQLTALNLLPNTTYFVLVDGLDRTPTNQFVDPAEVSFRITVSGSAVEINTSSDATIFAGGSTVLEAFGSTDNQYQWSPAESLNNNTGNEVIASPLVTTLYTVTGEIASCTSASSIQVTVINKIEPYEIFTPNNDGFNDEWDIPGLSLFPRAIVKVYDVKGQAVFESIGYPEARRWKGDRNGNPVPAGTYFYVIDVNQPGVENDLIKGKVTIVR
jgi:gliding motility-associated-like protein